MSNFIPMVSSSPPPMEDGGFDWDDDDDDFGTFTGADDGGSCIQIENQSKSQDSKIPIDTTASHDTNSWPTQNGGISPEPSENITLSSNDIDESSSIDEQLETRPRNIEIDSNVGDTDLPKIDVEGKGPLTDSGLYSANVSPIQQAEHVSYNEKTLDSDKNMYQEYSCSTTKNNDLEKSNEDNSSSHIVQHEEIMNANKIETSEINCSQSESPDLCDRINTLDSEICIKSSEESSQHSQIDSENTYVKDTEDTTDLSSSNIINHDSIPTDKSSSSIQIESQTESESDKLTTEQCDRTSPSRDIDSTESIETRTGDMHDSDLRDEDEIKQNESEVKQSIGINEHIETTKTVSQDTTACHSIAETEAKETTNHQENIDQEQVENEILSSVPDSLSENKGTDDWGDFDTSFEATPVNEKAPTSSSSELQSVSEPSRDIPEQMEESSDQSHASVGLSDSKSVKQDHDFKSEYTEKHDDDSNVRDMNDLYDIHTSSSFGKFDVACDSGNKDNDDYGNFAATDDDDDQFGDFNETCDLDTKEVPDISDKSELTKKEDTNDGFGDFKTQNTIPLENNDDEFGDFNASNEVIDGNAADDDDFGDFNSVNNVPDKAKDNHLKDSQTENEIQDDDGFGDFSAINDIPDKNGDDDFGDFNTNDDFGDFDKAPGGFAAFGDTDSGDKEEGPNSSENNWAAFSGSQTVESADFVPEDGDEWAAFNEEPTVVSSTPPSSKPIPQNMSPQEKLLFAVTTVFPGLSVDSAADSNVTDLDNVVQDRTQTQGEVSVWLQIRAVHSTNAISYQYTKSHWNDRLFTCLHVDTRNVLIGHKKAPVPVFASGLTMLEPTKGSTAAPLKPEVLVDTSKSSSTDHPPQSQEAIPPAQFDWSSSGLKNPLEADNKTLNLDFLIQDQAVKSNALESEFLGTDSFVTPLKPSMQPLETILANMKSVSTLKQVNNSQNISQEALKVVDTLPNLSFMRSKVLMFPLKLDQ